MEKRGEEEEGQEAHRLPPPAGMEFCRVNDVEEWTELDTAVGRVGGKVVFTMILSGGLMLMFLRDRMSSQTCTRVFNMLWKLAGPELFQRFFYAILTDNGAEFSTTGRPTTRLWRGSANRARGSWTRSAFPPDSAGKAEQA